MKKVVNTFWGKVEIVEVDAKHCKAILNGKEICGLTCSINDTEEKITKKIYSTLGKMKKNSYYN